MHNTKLSNIFFLFFLLFFVPGSFFAASDAVSQSEPSLEERLETLEQQQKMLERNLEFKEAELQEKEKQRAVVQIGSTGVRISSADGNNQFSFQGLVQADTRFYLDQDGQGATNTFLLRRVRPIFEGKFFKRFAFRFMPDFGENKVQLFDAYIDTMVFPQFKIRVGKYKAPVGLERLAAASALHFVERAFPTELVPNRELGVMFHGEILEGVLEYQAGIFNGIADGGNADFDLNNSKSFAGRVFAHPFKKTSIKAAQGLGLGIAGTIGSQFGDEENPGLPKYKTSGRQTFFRYLGDGTPEGTVVANGNRFRVSPQLYYYYKGFGLLGEYVLSSQNVNLNGQQQTIQNYAWQIATSYVIGADNAYGNIHPRKPLGWKKGGTGAFEFAARYSEITIDPEAFPVFADPEASAQKAGAWGVGFNWIVNDNVKLMLDFEQTHFEGGGVGGSDLRAENVILNRYQLSF